MSADQQQQRRASGGPAGAPFDVIAELAGFFAEHSLNWTRFRDLEPYLAELDDQLEHLDVKIIADSRT